MNRLLLLYLLAIAGATAFVFTSCGNWGMTQFWVELVEEIPDGVRDVIYSVNLVSNRSPEDAEVRVVLETPSSIPSGFTEGLPDGLTLSEDGLLSGTPTESGAFIFTACAQVMIHPQVYTDRTIKRRTYKLFVNTFEWARKITDDTDTCNSPDIAADSAGNTHSVWRRYDTTDSAYVLVYAVDAETAEIQTQELTDPAVEDVVSAAVAVGDVGGTETAGVAWVTTEGTDVKIKFATADDWTGSLEEVSLGNGVEADCDMLYADNNWYVVYAVRGGANDGLYIWQPDGTPGQITSGIFYNPRIGADESGNLFVVSEGSSIHLFVQDGGGWQNHNVSTEGQDPDLCVDGDTVYVVWQEDVAGTEHILYREFGDGEFSGDEIDLCEGRNPRIVKSPVTGSLWLTFQRYNDDTLVWEPYWAIVFGGAVTVEKSLADYTPPLQSVSVEPVAMVARSTPFAQAEAVILLHNDTDEVIYWCSYTPHAWSYPETVPPAVSGNRCYWPTIAVAPDGTMYTLWTEFQPPDYFPSGQNDIFLSINDGSGWSTPINVSDSSNWSWHVAAALDSGGKPHFVWYEYDPVSGNSWVYYGNYDVTVAGGIYKENITSSYTYATWPSIAIDTNNTIHIVYKGKDTFNTQLTFYVKGSPGDWTAREQICYKPDGSNPLKSSDYRKISMNELGQVYAVWSERGSAATDKGPYYTDNTSGNWANGIYLESATNTECKTESLFLLENGIKLVTWHNIDLSRIRWTLDTGGGWSPAQTVCEASANMPTGATDGQTVVLFFSSGTKIIGSVFNITTLSWRNVFIQSNARTSYGICSTEGSFYMPWCENYTVVWSKWR